MSRMAEFTPALFALCTPLHQGSALIGTDVAAMALLGLAGSVVHCGPMCGPLVLGQTAFRLSSVPCAKMSELQRLRAGLLPRYHVGRVTTYAMLGAVAGSAGLGVSAMLRPLSAVLLILAAAGLLLAAWKQGSSSFLKKRTNKLLQLGLRGRHERHANWQKPRTSFSTKKRFLPPGSLSFGLILGLMPCGLLYTALLAAAATASPIYGGLAMAAFGAGTVPALGAIGIAGHTSWLTPWLTKAAPAMFAINACVLIGAAFATLN